MTKKNDPPSRKIIKSIIEIVTNMVLLLIAVHYLHAADNQVITPSSYPQDQFPPNPTALYLRWLDCLVNKTESSIDEALRNGRCRIDFHVYGLVDCEETIKYITSRVANTDGLICIPSNDLNHAFYRLDWCSKDSLKKKIGRQQGLDF